MSEEPLAHAEYAQKLAEDGIAAFEHVRENLSAAFKRQKKYYDLVGKVKDAFPEGQLCWYYDPVKKKGRSPKLQSPWRGPVKVVGVNSDILRCVVVNSRGRLVNIHVDRLKPYTGENAPAWLQRF